MVSLYDLEEEVTDEIKELFEELDDEGLTCREMEKKSQDLLTEIVDSSVPIYNTDIMDVARSNISEIALPEAETLAFDGTCSPINASAGNIYRHLDNKAREYREKLLENMGC